MIDGEQHRGARLAAFAFGGLLLGALIGGVVVLTRDDGADAPASVDPDAPVAGVVTEDVPIEEIVLGGLMTTQRGDEILIWDGMATTDERSRLAPGADPHLRVWTLSASDPSTATEIDFPDVGPLGFVEAWWWDGRWGLAGYECPNLLRGTHEDNLSAACGSTEMSVLAVDPAAATVEPVGGVFEATPPNGGREDLQPVAVNGGTTMLRWGPSRELVTVTLEGHRVDVDDLDLRRRSAIVPDGESFAALTRTGLGYAADEAVTAPRLLGDFVTFHRLVGTTWVEEPLPTFPTDVLGADISVQGTDLAVSYRDPENQPGWRILLIGETGESTWDEFLPADIEPPDTRLRLLDGSTTLECDQLLELGEDRCRLVIVPR